MSHVERVLFHWPLMIAAVVSAVLLYGVMQFQGMQFFLERDRLAADDQRIKRDLARLASRKILLYRIGQYEKEIAEQNQRLVDLRNQQEDRRRELGEVRVQYEDMEKNVRRKREELSELSASEQSVKLELSSKKKEIKEIEDKISETEEEHIRAKRKFDDDFKRWNENIATLKEQQSLTSSALQIANEARTELEETKGLVDSFGKEIGALRSELVGTDGQAQTLSGRLVDMQAKMASSEASINALNQNANKLLIDFNEKADRILAELGTEAEKRQRTVAALEDRIKDQVEKLEQSLAQHASTTQRVRRSSRSRAPIAAKTQQTK